MTRPESMRQHPKGGQTEPRGRKLIMARFSFARPLLIGFLCTLLPPVTELAGSASAQGTDGFPRQPVRIIVPFAAGGAPRHGGTPARSILQRRARGRDRGK